MVSNGTHEVILDYGHDGPQLAHSSTENKYLRLTKGRLLFIEARLKGNR